MPNFDDIFNADSPQKEQPVTEYIPFDKEEWAQQKRQERDQAYAMMDETALHMANSGELFQTYLQVQAHFDRYSVGNALLITAQKPDATELADFDTWKASGAYIKKGEAGIVLLEPGDKYTKEDGTVGMNFNTKKVFDISQTTVEPKAKQETRPNDRLLLKALIHDAPCRFTITDQLKEGNNAIYSPEDKTIYVRAGMEAPDIFRAISFELAHAHLDKGEYKRSEASFTAYCVAYVLCNRYDMAKDKFRFARLPESLSSMDAGEVRAELSKIRDVANEISTGMNKLLENRQRAPKEAPDRSDEAR